MGWGGMRGSGLWWDTCRLIEVGLFWPWDRMRWVEMRWAGLGWDEMEWDKTWMVKVGSGKGYIGVTSIWCGCNPIFLYFLPLLLDCITLNWLAWKLFLWNFFFLSFQWATTKCRGRCDGWCRETQANPTCSRDPASSYPITKSSTDAAGGHTCTNQHSSRQ